MADSKQIDWLTLLAFLGIVLFGGSNAVAVRFSNQGLPPFWGAAFRFGSAAVIFWIVFLIRRSKLPRGRALTGTLIYGILTIGISYMFLYWALQFLPASTTMLIGALGPLITFLLAWAHGQESFRWRGLVGSMVAFLGIFFAFGNQIGGELPLVSILAVVAGFSAISEGTVLYKSYPRIDPITVNAISLTVGTIILLIISLIAGESWQLPADQTTWISYAYLVVGGSVGLFYLVLVVLNRWTASATSYAFLLFPIATILIASWLADEVITPRFLLGTVIVLLGVWLGAIASSGSKQTE